MKRPIHTIALLLLALACSALTPCIAAQLPTLLLHNSAPPPLNPHAPISAWSAATKVVLPWDVQHQRAASERSVARITTDGKTIYVRFDVKQREVLLAQQHQNNVGDGTDDEVWIDLWPNGGQGFYYQFAATSNGTHFQYSSENTAYSPTWKSYGAVQNGGFTVTMAIPLAIMRSSGSSANWQVQFVRIVRSTGERQIWSYGAAQTDGDDVTYAGHLLGLGVAAAAKPQPRVGVYGLGAIGAPNQGLTTSRVGADLSIPITPTASFYATLHPDFSNVEVDQATISPTAFARQYHEVRPFFTQGAQFYDNFSCNACPNISQLYTPKIPTPRDGYAVEGKQGPVSFAAFNADGVQRSDAAQTAFVTSKNNQWRLTLERVAANAPLVHDNVFASGLSYNDNKHVEAYFNYGSDSGNLVALGNQAQHYDFGTFISTNTAGAAFSMRKVGYYYNPVDGFVEHPDIAGYAGYLAKIFLFSGNSKLNSISLTGFIDRYHNAAGALNQSDTSFTFDLLTKSRIDVNASVGSAYVLESNCIDGSGALITVTPANYSQYIGCQVFTPVSQNGVGITYHSGTANSPGNAPDHGATSTPTSLSFNTGRFGPGRVDAWTRSTTMRAGLRATFSLELDDTRQYLDAGGVNTQWLERVGYTRTLTPDSSFSIGIRRIFGTPLLVYTNNPVYCTTYLANPVPGTACTGAWNLSFAYHKRTPHDEFYFAYGDASQQSTVPQFIAKWIHYIGAEKGT